jgi:hypothetical protein
MDRPDILAGRSRKLRFQLRFLSVFSVQVSRLSETGKNLEAC